MFSTAKHIKFIQCLCIRNNKTLKVCMKTIKRMKSLNVLKGFKVIKIYVDRAFELCHLELAEMGIELVCCDKGAHVHFAERGIIFIKGRIKCVRLMLQK